MCKYQIMQRRGIFSFCQFKRNASYIILKMFTKNKTKFQMPNQKLLRMGSDIEYRVDKSKDGKTRREKKIKRKRSRSTIPLVP